ncbi:hypothetical protein BH11ARM2_BH11ARM2_06620 [soil metagenome]
MRFLPILLLSVVLAGCGSAPPVAATPAQSANEKEWTDLTTKMNAMTSEQRAQYIKDHPDEMARLAGPGKP